MFRNRAGKTVAIAAVLAASIGSAFAGTQFQSPDMSKTEAAPAAGTALTQDASELMLLAVPIPTSVVLLGSALVGVMALGRRKSKTQFASAESSDNKESPDA